MSDQFGTIYGGNTGLSYEDLVKRKAIAEMLTGGKYSYPKTFGEGLASVGQSLADAFDVRRDQRIAQQQSADAFKALQNAPPDTGVPIPDIYEPDATAAPGAGPQAAAGPADASSVVGYFPPTTPQAAAANVAQSGTDDTTKALATAATLDLGGNAPPPGPSPRDQVAQAAMAQNVPQKQVQQQLSGIAPLTGPQTAGLQVAQLKSAVDPRNSVTAAAVNQQVSPPGPQQPPAGPPVPPTTLPGVGKAPPAAAATDEFPLGRKPLTVAPKIQPSPRQQYLERFVASPGIPESSKVGARVELQRLQAEQTQAQQQVNQAHQEAVSTYNSRENEAIKWRLGKAQRDVDLARAQAGLTNEQLAMQEHNFNIRQEPIQARKNAAEAASAELALKKAQSLAGTYEVSVPQNQALAVLSNIDHANRTLHGANQEDMQSWYNYGASHLPNVLQPYTHYGNEQMLAMNSARDLWVDAIARDEANKASVVGNPGRSEDFKDAVRAKYFPMPGDSVGTIRDKEVLRTERENALRNGLGTAAPVYAQQKAQADQDYEAGVANGSIPELAPIKNSRGEFYKNGDTASDPQSGRRVQWKDGYWFLVKPNGAAQVR